MYFIVKLRTLLSCVISIIDSLGVNFVIFFKTLLKLIYLNFLLKVVTVRFVLGSKPASMLLYLLGKYQIKPQSSPCFTAAGATGITNRNHIFRVCQLDSSGPNKYLFVATRTKCKHVFDGANYLLLVE